MYTAIPALFLGLNVDTVVFELHKARFPADKWQSLASGLRMATAVSTIDADCRNSVGKLQELIRRWVGNTTGNQWVMLIDAIVMCDEPAVAQELATSVGCPLASSGTTTVHCLLYVTRSIKVVG